MHSVTTTSTAQRASKKIARAIEVMAIWIFLCVRKAGFRCGETEPTQRNRYFSDLDLALRYDAIEAGILPIVLAFHELGAMPKFSCEGHATAESTHIPYVCAWINPTLVQTTSTTVDAALKGALHYDWYLEVEDSRASKLASAGAGEDGAFLTLRWSSSPHRLRPSSGRDPVYFLKDFVAADVNEIAARLQEAARH